MTIIEGEQVTATLTDGGRRSGHKDWGKIIEQVHEDFPGTRIGQSQIRQSFAGNTDLMAAVLRDVLRVGQTPVKRGQRTMPELTEGLERLKAIRGDDFTTLPFHRAFQVIAGGLYLRELSERTGLSITQLSRLRAGDGGRHGRRAAPTPAEMEAIAKAFGKEPCYFTEYRAYLVSAMIHNEMLANPEMSASLVNRLR